MRYPDGGGLTAEGRSRRCRTVQIRAGQHTLAAEDPLPPGLREAFALIKGPAGAQPGW